MRSDLQVLDAPGRHYLIVALVVFILSLGWVGIQWLVQDPIIALMLTGTLAMLSYPLARSWIYRDSNLLEPVLVDSVLLTLAYPVHVIMPFLIGGYAAAKVPYWEDIALLRHGLWLVIIGIAAYLFTYYLTPETFCRFGRPEPRGNYEIKWEWRILAVASIGWAVRLYSIATGNFSTFYRWSGYDPNSSVLLVAFSQLIWFAYILAWLNFILNPRRFSSIAIPLGLTILEAGFHLSISTSKTYLLYLLIYPMMAYYLVKRRAPLLPLVAIGVALVIVITPFVMHLREVQQDWRPEDNDPWVTAQLAYEVLKNTLTDTNSAEVEGLAAGQYVVLRFGGFESLAVLLREVPDHADYLYFKDFMLLPFALVPRLVFPWKPDSQGVQTFSGDIYGGGGGGVSIFPIGDGYYNLGDIGVILIMASWGFLQRWYYAGFFKPREHSMFVMATFIYLYFHVIEVDSFLEMRYVALIQNAAILGALYFLLFSPRILNLRNYGLRQAEMPE